MIPLDIAVNDFNQSVVKASLPRQLKLKFKSRCAQQGFKMKAVLETLIYEWVQSGGSLSGFVEPSALKLSGVEEDIKVYIHSSLKMQFKVLCVRQNVAQRQVLYHLIDQWVSRTS